MSCTPSDHARLKATAELWLRLPDLGTRVYHFDDGGPDEVLEHRNCPACGSTLVRAHVVSRQEN